MATNGTTSDRPDRTPGLRALLRVPADPDAARARLAEITPDSIPAGPSSKDDGKDALQKYGDELYDLQERFYAAARGGVDRRILIVLQGMDTSGKGGVIEHVIGLINPGGVRIHSFKTPTEEERQHDFLWRVRRALPGQGQIGIFDRSHYEDVLIAKVRQLVDADTIEQRYAQINEFEKELVDDGYTLLKCFLNISKNEQKERLLARLDDPTKHWKFNPGDVDERALWDDYQDAYFLALTRCSTEHAPWYAVPSDRKWYRNWAIGQLLVETLRELDPQYPRMDFDVEEQRQRLLTAD
ncbi:PPK2 family polyphosphate kinase [Blastococcus sp. Marseille-P5729]|uniref:PPK2 family polyphosphate kinase n=1 Tax=Blastococcus sp. Marseille-P5729 TaxID=2086582 RepID=UPI0018FECBD0|nr:PPK2 family polyphosphate kinase [Blastococcus sp. Marseille-P5729]